MGVGRVWGEGGIFVGRGGYGGKAILGNFLKGGEGGRGGYLGGENLSEKYLDFKKRLGLGSAEKKGVKRGVSIGNLDCGKNFGIEV